MGLNLDYLDLTPIFDLLLTNKINVVEITFKNSESGEISGTISNGIVVVSFRVHRLDDGGVSFSQHGATDNELFHTLPQVEMIAANFHVIETLLSPIFDAK